MDAEREKHESDRAFVANCESVMRRMAHTIKTVIGKDGALSAVDRVKQELTEGDE